MPSRPSFWALSIGGLAASLVCAAIAVAAGPAVSAPPPSDPSVEAYEAYAPVLMGPRCMNCHTVTGFPRQGDDGHPHRFNVQRGPSGHGAVGLACSTCHIDRNQPASGVPGAPRWGLAPLSMAWEGLSAAQICQVMVNRATNGNRDTAALVEHMTTDPLVGWAWHPGSDAHGRPRTGPAVAKARFDMLVKQWAATGAHCPHD